MSVIEIVDELVLRKSDGGATVDSCDKLVETPTLYFITAARLAAMIDLTIVRTVRGLSRVVRASQHALTVLLVDPARDPFSFQSQITRFACRCEIILNDVQFFY